MKQKISLVLSGGGARGIAHIGVIEELEKHRFEICSIAGTSMGSLVGGVYALGKLEIFKEWMLSLDKIKLLSLVDFTFSSQGLVKGDKVFNKMKKFMKDENIEDLDIPFVAVAVDIIKKKEMVFTRGSLYDAIRASVSIPSVFTPVKKEEALLIDGGVLNNIPVNHVKRMPNDILVAVNVNADVPVVNPSASKKELQEKQTLHQERVQSFKNYLKKVLPGNSKEKMGYFELVNQTISLMTYTIAQMAVEKTPPDLMINISRQSAGTYDFFKADELIDMGRLAARNSLK